MHEGAPSSGDSAKLFSKIIKKKKYISATNWKLFNAFSQVTISNYFYLFIFFFHTVATGSLNCA